MVRGHGGSFVEYFRDCAGKARDCSRSDCPHTAAGGGAVAGRDGGHNQGRQPGHGRYRHRGDDDGHNGRASARGSLQQESDHVLPTKLAFIAKHNLVVWRFHDHWHLRKPDGIVAGMVHALGWEKYEDAQNEHLFTIPETTMEKLAADLKVKLSTHAMRVVADPHQRVKRVA